MAVVQAIKKTRMVYCSDFAQAFIMFIHSICLLFFLDSEKNIIVVYGTSTYANYPGLFRPNIRNHQHEEADTLIPTKTDTLIPMHVLDASRTNGDICDIDVYSPDTDICVL